MSKYSYISVSKISKSSESGFTLIEIIMALVVLSMSLIPLFSIFSGHIDAMRRMGDENAKTAATFQIVNYLEAINPKEQSEGNFDFDDYSFSWNAMPILENFDNAEGQRSKGHFKMSLHETDVKVTKANGQDWFNFQIRQTGYEKTETASPGITPPPPLEEDEEDGQMSKSRKAPPLPKSPGAGP